MMATFAPENTNSTTAESSGLNDSNTVFQEKLPTPELPAGLRVS